MSPLPSRSSRFITIGFSLLLVFGIVLLVLYFSQPSEAGNQFLFGLSATRLLIGGIFAALVLSTAFAVLLSIRQPGSLAKFADRLSATEQKFFTSLTFLYASVLVLGGLLTLTLLPVAKQAEEMLGIIVRLNVLILWLLAAGVILGYLLFYLYKDAPAVESVFSPLRLVLWFWMFLGVYIVLVNYYRVAAYVTYLDDFETPLLWLGFFYLVWSLVNATQIPNKERVARFFLLAGIFLTVFVLYGHLADWVDWVHKTRFEYWDSLAHQFVNGKLYLADGSVTNFTTHDLTLHNGKWYVPIPPLPAILLMPVMFFASPEDIFMGDVSMLMGALNAVLVYLILEQLAARKWVTISRNVQFLLVLLFAFGTNHLWVSVMGEVWFVSQIITVTFLALAVFAALRDGSPWAVGAFLGIAMLARPNSLMTWPFAFAIAMQIRKDHGLSVDLKEIWRWHFRSAAPIVLAILGLLSYNYLRFENFLDFGYVTISGDPTIMSNAQRYGIFSPVYILHNLQVMFLNLPQIRLGETWLFKPSMDGMSIFLSTPVLIYLFRRYENRWWVIGAWASILFGFLLLVMYHNTGSAQFGYRYILDAIIPIMALMSLPLQKKLPWHYYLLLLLSILINIYGTAWFVKAG